MSNTPKSGIGTLENDGKLCILRLNAELDPRLRAEYPNLLTMSLAYTPEADSGLPSPAVNQSMGEFEQLMEEALEGPDQGRLTMAMINDGLRLWQWYTRDEKQTMALVKKALGDWSGFDVRFTHEQDPSWERFAEFCELYATSKQTPFTESADDSEDAGDRQVLRVLTENGLSLTKAYLTAHYFELPTRRAAEEVARALQATGMKLQQVSPAPCAWWKRLLGMHTWICVVETTAVPEEKAVLATSARHRKIAGEHGGQYDGWEVAVGDD